MNRAWTGRARPLAGLVAATLAVFALSLAGLAPASADDGKSDHSDGTSATAGDTASPQPESTADQNDGGANGQCPDGPYCSTRDGSPSGNGNGNGEATGEPCAGCVGKADNKNPKGQNPDGSDNNAGYECDSNKGVGQSNPAHTGCTSGEESPSAEPASCAGDSTSTGEESTTSGDDESADDSADDESAGESADDESADDESTGESADDESGGDESEPAKAGHEKADHGDHADEGDQADDGDQADATCAPCPADSSMSSGDDDTCAPCPDEASMGDDEGSEDGDQECPASAGSTPVPASPEAAPAAGANRPPVVAGVQAFGGPKAGDAADLATAPAAGGILPSAGVLPNTGAGWALMLAAVLGAGLVLIGSVTLLRRRGARS